MRMAGKAGIVAWVLGATLLAGCQQNERPAGPDPAVLAAAWAGITALQANDTVVGTGVEATPGAQVEVHYEGWLYDPLVPNRHGVRFDSSRDTGRPFRFRLGTGRVIKGWDEGVIGMKAGGRRELVIPASLAYGERGAGGGVIPPGAALVFDIELLRVEP